MKSIILFIIIGVCYSTCYSTPLTRFDCTYSCSRGSCATRHEKGEETLKCENVYVDGSWTHVWQCYDALHRKDFGLPYRGHIKQCNVTGCNPPWGCSLSSFTISQDTCKNMDSFCESKYNVCCENDDMCDPYYKHCTPSMTLYTNTDTTNNTNTKTKPHVTLSPSSGNPNRSLDIGLGVGAIVLLLGVGVTIGVIINRRQRHFVTL